MNVVHCNGHMIPTKSHHDALNKDPIMCGLSMFFFMGDCTPPEPLFRHSKQLNVGLYLTRGVEPEWESGVDVDYF